MFAIVRAFCQIMVLAKDSDELKNYLAETGLSHTRGRPYHPQTQGKIKRYQRSMKNILLLDNYCSPDDLKAEIKAW